MSTKEQEIYIVKEKSSVLFKEISSGVYEVIKDRFDELNEFCDSRTVVNELNNNGKVAIHTLKGEIIKNFNVN